MLKHFSPCLMLVNYIPEIFRFLILIMNNIQEKATALAENKILPPLHSSTDVRPLTLDDFKKAHEQVQYSMNKFICIMFSNRSRNSFFLYFEVWLFLENDKKRTIWHVHQFLIKFSDKSLKPMTSQASTKHYI